MAPASRLFLLGVSFFLVAACKTPKGVSHGKDYTSQYYHGATRPYATFSINPVSDTGSSLTVFNRARIVATTRALMVRKGLTPGDATADLLVNIVSVDSSRSGQQAGRPLNNWYRLFHGDRVAPGRVGPQEIVGTLIPESLLENRDTVPARRDSAAPADTQPTPPPPPAYIYGALIIDVIDRDKRVLLWEGVANRAVDVPARDADKRIPAIVGRLLDRFSPKGDDSVTSRGPAGRQTPK